MESGEDEKSGAVWRIVDVNLNRLREALRVIEEYYRFDTAENDTTYQLKSLRHELEEIEKKAGRETLLHFRNIETDPLASSNRKEELDRNGLGDVVSANFKRAQEAARVLEDCLKVTRIADMSEKAKGIRFQLYTAEKKFFIRESA